MKIRNLAFVFVLGVLGFMSCTDDQDSTFTVSELDSLADSDVSTRSECCDFTYTIDSTQSFGLCCIYIFTITNNGDCPITVSDNDNVLTQVPAGKSTTYKYAACEGDADESGNVILTLTFEDDGESTVCGTIPLPNDCYEGCDCQMVVVNNGCILYAETSSGCENPYSFFWTYPSGATSTHWGITARYTGEYCLTLTDGDGCTVEDCIFVTGCEF